MKRAVPILPTLVVLAAVAVMVRMGFWQLDRLHQKEALLARYAAAAGQDFGPVGNVPEGPEWLYRHVTVRCDKVEGWQKMAGTNARGESGIAHVATCKTSNGDDVKHADVVIGWSRDLHDVSWAGGMVSGTLSPGRNNTARLTADPPLAGLEANARPDPADIPNNHLSYAIQWFLFALTALVIYAIALRKRWKERA